MSPPSIWKLPPKHSHFAETRSISLMQAAGTRIPLIERKGYLRSPIRNEVEHSAKKILAECSTRWPSAQYFRSIIQPNYQHRPQCGFFHRPLGNWTPHAPSCHESPPILFNSPSPLHSQIYTRP